MHFKFLNKACNSKMTVCREIRSEIWDSEVAVVSIWGTFDILVLRIILGTFGTIVF